MNNIDKYQKDVDDFYNHIIKATRIPKRFFISLKEERKKKIIFLLKTK